jgi:hypothetical protein
MPIQIENDQYEFDLKLVSHEAGNTTAEFQLYLEVQNVLVIYPVKIDITVVPNSENSNPESKPNQENAATD